MNADQLMEGARAFLRERLPYLTVALYGLEVVRAPGRGTWGVSATGTLMVDDEATLAWAKGPFTDEQKKLAGTPVSCSRRAEEAIRYAVIGGVYAHEVLHPVLDHHGRAVRAGVKTREEHDDWNECADYAVNCTLRDAGIPLPEGSCYPEQKGLPAGQTVEWYYQALRARRQPQGQQPPPKPGKGPPQPGQGRGGGQKPPGAPQGAAKPGGGSKGKAPSWKAPDGAQEPCRGECGTGAGGNPLPGESEALEGAEGRTEREIEAVRRAVVAAAQEHEARKGRGSVPAGLQVEFGEILKPPTVPWEQQLRFVVSRLADAITAGTEHASYGMPSQRQGGLGWGACAPILPRTVESPPDIAVIIDTSGSMLCGCLQAVLAELKGLFELVNARVRVIPCDYKAYDVLELEDFAGLVGKLVGGGGTSMVPAFEKLNTLRRPDLCLVLTDGEVGDIGTKPKYEVLWVTPSTGFTPQWGNVVRIGNQP